MSLTRMPEQALRNILEIARRLKADAQRVTGPDALQGQSAPVQIPPHLASPFDIPGDLRSIGLSEECLTLLQPVMFSMLDVYSRALQKLASVPHHPGMPSTESVMQKLFEAFSNIYHREVLPTLREKILSYLSSESDDRFEEVEEKQPTFNSQYIPFLLEYFKYNAYPALPDRQAMAKRTGMLERQIEVWFQNRRRRLKSQNPTVPLIRRKRTDALPADLNLVEFQKKLVPSLRAKLPPPEPIIKAPVRDERRYGSLITPRYPLQTDSSILDIPITPSTPPRISETTSIVSLNSPPTSFEFPKPEWQRLAVLGDDGSKRQIDTDDKKKKKAKKAPSPPLTAAQQAHQNGVMQNLIRSFQLLRANDAAADAPPREVSAPAAALAATHLDGGRMWCVKDARGMKGVVVRPSRDEERRQEGIRRQQLKEEEGRRKQEIEQRRQEAEQRRLEAEQRRQEQEQRKAEKKTRTPKKKAGFATRRPRGSPESDESRHSSSSTAVSDWSSGAETLGSRSSSLELDSSSRSSSMELPLDFERELEASMLMPPPPPIVAADVGLASFSAFDAFDAAWNASMGNTDHNSNTNTSGLSLDSSTMEMDYNADGLDALFGDDGFGDDDEAMPESTFDQTASPVFNVSTFDESAPLDDAFLDSLLKLASQANVDFAAVADDLTVAPEFTGVPDADATSFDLTNVIDPSMQVDLTTDIDGSVAVAYDDMSYFKDIDLSAAGFNMDFDFSVPSTSSFAAPSSTSFTAPSSTFEFSAATFDAEQFRDFSFTFGGQSSSSQETPSSSSPRTTFSPSRTTFSPSELTLEPRAVKVLPARRVPSSQQTQGQVEQPVQYITDITGRKLQIASSPSSFTPSTPTRTLTSSQTTPTPSSKKLLGFNFTNIGVVPFGVVRMG
ncbi:hypothetical protein C8J56DRAFT_1021706 [Mycena floridula]|nr:hypothetical protein C8J56DRAFT_1021706 [Mycena floridula]